MAASVPTKTTLPVLSNILLEATKDGIRLSGTDLDIAVSTTRAGVGGPGGRDHPAGPEAGRDRARAAQRRHPDRPPRASSGSPSSAAAPSSSCSDCRARSSPPFRRSSSTAAGRRPPEDLQKLIAPRGLRGEHRGEPADPERRALGAPARPDAHGGHQRPPAGPDGRAHRAGAAARPGRPDRAAQGAGADPPALRAGRRDRDRPEREPPRLPVRHAPRSSPGSSRGRTRTTSR